MSSAIKKFSQIDPRLKHLVTLDTTKYLTNTEYEAIAAQYGGRTVIVAPPPTITSTFDANVLLKDLGRELYINTSLPNKKIVKTAVLRQVQLVSGATSNGVSPPPPDWMTGWVVTWSAVPAGDYAVTVVRTA